MDLGAVAGYQFGSYVRTELGYRYTPSGKNTVLASGILQYRIPSTAITPYAHAGFGLATTNHETSTVYSAGAGARLAVATNVELDARYSYTGAFKLDGNLPSAGYNSFTLGANFRF
jgi:opacity protein-like surface antigen